MKNISKTLIKPKIGKFEWICHMLKAKDTHNVLISTRACVVLENGIGKYWEHFLVLQVKRNVRGQQHILCLWFLEFMFNDILLKNSSTETTWPQNLILVNAALPCQTMMGDSWGRMHVSMACCSFGCSRHFPPLQWTRRTFAVVGIFPFIPMGMLRF